MKNYWAHSPKTWRATQFYKISTKLSHPWYWGVLPISMHYVNQWKNWWRIQFGSKIATQRQVNISCCLLLLLLLLLLLTRRKWRTSHCQQWMINMANMTIDSQLGWHLLTLNTGAFTQWMNHLNVVSLSDHHQHNWPWYLNRYLLPPAKKVARR